MKRINIYYWISIGLILFFFVYGAIQNIMKAPEWVEVFKMLGYPEYLLPFLGVAKLSACVVLVLPFFKRLKEWAYAGLFFDIIGATYSAYMVGGIEDPRIFFMILPIATVLVSYWLWIKKSAQA